MFSSNDTKEKSVVFRSSPSPWRTPVSNLPVLKQFGDLDRREGRFSEWKFIAIAQRSSFVTSEGAAQIGGSTPKNRLRRDPAGNCQPRPSTCSRRGYDQLVITRNKARVTGWKFFVSDPHFKGSAAPSYDSLISETKPERS
jgi:hypothetical protein